MHRPPCSNKTISVFYLLRLTRNKSVARCNDNQRRGVLVATAVCPCVVGLLVGFSVCSGFSVGKFIQAGFLRLDSITSLALCNRFNFSLFTIISGSIPIF